MDEASNTLVCVGKDGGVNEGYISKTNLKTGVKVVVSPITSFEIDYFHCKLDPDSYD